MTQLIKQTFILKSGHFDFFSISTSLGDLHKKEVSCCECSSSASDAHSGIPCIVLRFVMSYPEATSHLK